MAEKILVFTYNYVPYNVTGTFRIMRFVKYFPQNGFTPVVLTADQGNEGISELLRKEVPPNAEIIRKRSIFKTKDKLGTGKKTLYTNDISYVKSIAKYIVRFVKDVLLSPDKQILWSIANIPHIIRILRKSKIKYLYVNCGPFSLAVAGVLVKKICGVKLIIDFRDPWVSNHSQLKQTYIRKKFNEFYEGICIKNADLVVSVTNELIDDLRRRHKFKTKYLLIPNGFDPDDYSNLGKCKRYVNDASFKFIYGGKVDIFSHFYNPATVLEGFKLFQETYNIQNAELILYSSMSRETRVYIERKKVKNVIIHDYVERTELLNILYQAGAFIHYIYPQSSPESISLKIFEYAALGKPIISINTEEGSTAKFLFESRAGFSCKNVDIDNISELFYRAYCMDSEEFKANVNVEFINQYAVNKLTDELVKHIKAI